MKILSIFNIHQVNNIHTFKYIYMLMLDYGKHLSFRTVYRYFKRFSCQLFKWFSKNIHPRKKLQLWDMMSNLLPVIFCSGPVYLYAIHILTSNLLFFGQYCWVLCFYCSRIVFVISLQHDFHSVIQIYDLSENILRFWVRPSDNRIIES